MSGVLHIIATPIGNLGDLSPRAAEVLRVVPFVLAEDTRRARVLLEHVGGQGRLLSCHQHNERARAEWAIDTLRSGASLAFVSDAGAPSVSDPGGRLVEAVAASGLSLEVIPGASAVIAALMGAGVDVTRFAFLGFLPRRAGARRALLSRVDPGFALVIFEAPARVAATLEALASELGPRRVVVARELTKRFETFHRGTLGEALSPPLVERGELVIVVEGGGEHACGEGSVVSASDDVPAVFASPRERAKFWAKRWGISTREAYERLRLGEAGADAARGEHERAPAPAPEAMLAPRLVAGDLEPVAQAIEARARRSETARGRARAALRASIEAFLQAERAAAGSLAGDGGERAWDLLSEDAASAAEPESISLVSALSRVTRARTALPAPVESEACARALVAALAALEDLDEAIEAVADATR